MRILQGSGAWLERSDRGRGTLWRPNQTRRGRGDPGKW